jgi:hypothetical protein
MMIPHQYERLRGALSVFAARFAESATMSPEQLRLPLRRQPRSMPRQGRLEPAPSRQFVRAMATKVARDRRLAPRAAALATLIVAIAGRAGRVDVTRGYFAAKLGASERTVARLLAQLRACGYVRTVQTIGQYGETTGLRIQLLDALLPYWEAEPVEVGVTNVTPLQESFHKQVSEELPVVAYPRYRRPRD